MEEQTHQVVISSGTSDYSARLLPSTQAVASRHLSGVDRRATDLAAPGGVVAVLGRARRGEIEKQSADYAIAKRKLSPT